MQLRIVIMGIFFFHFMVLIILLLLPCFLNQKISEHLNKKCYWENMLIPLKFNWSSFRERAESHKQNSKDPSLLEIHIPVYSQQFFQSNCQLHQGRISPVCFGPHVQKLWLQKFFCNSENLFQDKKVVSSLAVLGTWDIQLILFHLSFCIWSSLIKSAYIKQQIAWWQSSSE